jgi:S-adenosylmethionine hydrolase
MIFLFTDFGSADIYVGQVKAALACHAPDSRVIDLLHEVPNFNALAGAHLLAALHEHIPVGSVTMAVVDPGVGSQRRPVAVNVDGRWYVGPDNGVLSVMAGRAGEFKVWRIDWKEEISHSFHSRDLFAPIAAMLDKREWRSEVLTSIDQLDVMFDAAALNEIIYIDHYGNAMTGMPASSFNDKAVLRFKDRKLCYARVFSEVEPGMLFWYRNSIGLIEIATNCANAAHQLGIRVGDTVE